MYALTTQGVDSRVFSGTNHSEHAAAFAVVCRALTGQAFRVVEVDDSSVVDLSEWPDGLTLGPWFDQFCEDRSIELLD